MRVLLVIIGILMICGGIFGMVSGMISGFLSLDISGLDKTLEAAVNSDAEASKYCKAGETLVKETGASSYTQGQGYASSVSYYCENAAGVRRDVTGEFVNSLVSGLGQTLGGIFPGFSLRTEFLAISGIGVVLIILASVVGRRQRAVVVDALGGGSFSVPGAMPVTPGSNQVISTPEAARIMKQAGAFNMPQAAGGTGDVLTKKLQQLEDARSKNLISQEEYDRLRQQILDQMR